MVVGYAQQLREARYYLQVAIDRLCLPAIRDDADVTDVRDALQAQHAALGELIVEA